MVEVAERQSFDVALRLAADVCLARGAFVADLTGTVRVSVSEAGLPDDLAQRMERLARSCLSHPAAHGRDLFWNAEVVTDAVAADRALSCAVVPMWLDRVQAGLLGIVDTWLPEPDDDQRGALVALAAELAPGVALGGAHDPAAACAPEPGGPAEPAWRAVGTGSPSLSAPAAGASGDVDRPLSAITWATPLPGERPTVLGTVGEPRRADAPETAGGPPGGAVEAAELVGALEDGVLCLDASGVVVLANRAAEVLYGLGPGESLVGSALPEARMMRTEEGQPLGDHQPGLLVLDDGIARSMQVLVGEKESQRRFSVSARSLTVGGGAGALVVMHDTTEEWLERQRLSRYAMYDPLTSLANRYLLLEELRRMLQGLGRRGGAVALVYLDLDRFKAINDEHGHDTGDEVLSALARRLRGAVRGDDVVARLGGDEFVLAHLSAESRPDGDLVVSRLRKVLSAPFRVRGQVFDVGASIGWVSTDRADVGPEALLARADRAMYQSKRERAAQRAAT